DVEGDREPLEREEERHEVRGADEERHSRRRREQEREELRDVLVVETDDVLLREQRSAERDGAEDRLRERGPAVAVEGVGDDAAAACAVDVEPDRRDDAAERAEAGDGRRERAPPWARHEGGAEQRGSRRP